MNTDVLLVITTDQGEVKVTNGWISSYEPPQIDDAQNFELKSASNANGFVNVWLTRPIAATNPDYNLDLSQCVYLLYPTGGGAYFDADGTIAKHDDRPQRSDEKICF